MTVIVNHALFHTLSTEHVAVIRNRGANSVLFYSLLIDAFLDRLETRFENSRHSMPPIQKRVQVVRQGDSQPPIKVAAAAAATCWSESDDDGVNASRRLR